MLQTNLKDIQNYKHIALYCRCGCTGPESGHVLQAQQDELLRWVEAIDLPVEKVSVYTDNCTGFYDKQHGLHKLLESLKGKDVPVLIAALSSDRFCRSFWQMTALAEQAARCGVCSRMFFIGCIAITCPCSSEQRPQQRSPPASSRCPRRSDSERRPRT